MRLASSGLWRWRASFFSAEAWAAIVSINTFLAASNFFIFFLSFFSLPKLICSSEMSANALRMTEIKKLTTRYLPGGKGGKRLCLP